MTSTRYSSGCDAYAAGDRRRLRAAEEKLSETVLASELTLISVLLGVLCSALILSAQTALRAGNIDAVAYVVLGTFMIVYVYASIMNHTISFISWPLEMVHNFLYLTLTIALGTQLLFVDTPAYWFAAQIGTGASGGAIAAVDNYILLQKTVDTEKSGRTAAAAMLRLATRHHRFRLIVVPALVPAGAVFWQLIVHFPGFWLDQRWHLLLACISIVGMAAACAVELTFTLAIREPILAAKAEALGEVAAATGGAEAVPLEATAADTGRGRGTATVTPSAPEKGVETPLAKP